MSFVLNESKKEVSNINLIYRNGLKNLFKYSIGVSIETKYWNFETQRAIVKGVDKSLISKHTFINGEISRYEMFLEKVVAEARMGEIKLTREYLKERFDEEFKESSVQSIKSDWEAIFNKFIQELKSGRKLTNKGKIYSKGRVEKYEILIKNLKYFFGDKKVSINDFDMEFLRDYTMYRNSNGIALNTLSYDIVMLKSILHSTFKDGLHQNRIFENPDFAIASETIENEFLDDQELDLLYEYKFSSKKLELVRDVFIIGCYTGLRISDLSQLNKDNISSDGLLKVIPEKTSDPVYIPIHWRVHEILQKYGGEPPKSYSSRNMNKYIKEMCREAGIDDKAYYKQTRGGKVHKEVKEKWERVSNHTARRSFATNLYLAGFDTISIMKLTGHKTESAFMNYICVTQRQMANRMKDHPYFKK